MKEVRDVLAPSRHGGPAIPVRIYVPHEVTPQNSHPLVFWIHGGGWVYGSITSDDRIARKVAKVRVEPREGGLLGGREGGSMDRCRLDSSVSMDKSYARGDGGTDQR
jgi:hypothetical protein